MKRLLNKDIKAYRDLKLKEQGGLCAMCKLPIDNTPCLDHDYKSDHVRQVACRTCNILLGKLENAKVRTGMDEERFIAFMQNISEYYLTDYSDNPIHPKQLSPEAKQLKQLKKQAKKLKTQTAKDRYKENIKALQDIVNRQNEDCWEP